VRIVEATSRSQTCTTVFEDGFVRREVSLLPLTGQQSADFLVFEGTISKSDLEGIKRILTSGDALSLRSPRYPMQINQYGRMVAFGVSQGSKSFTKAFADPDGKQTIPKPIQEIDRFSRNIKNQKWPMLKGKVSPVCRMNMRNVW